MSKSVGIILVNYQDYAQRFLGAVRDSLRAQTYAADSFKIYLVDNAATVESTAYLSQAYPEATILTRSDGNYAAANNLGMRRAIADGCEYVVTLNMDTEVDKFWLEELVKALGNNAAAGVAQSKIMLYPQDGDKSRARLNSLGNIAHFLGFGFTSAYGEEDREVPGYPEITGYASGCSFIMRADCFTKTGGYEEEFYMYHDDLELSWKARLAGYKIILVPLSVVYHKYEFSRSSRMMYYMERNRYLTLLMFYPLSLLALIAVPALFMELGLWLYALAGGRLREKFRVCAYFFSWRNYVKIWSARRRIKKLSTVNFSDLAKDFFGRIEFQEIDNPLLRYLVNPLLNLYWQTVKKFI